MLLLPLTMLTMPPPRAHRDCVIFVRRLCPLLRLLLVRTITPRESRVNGVARAQPPSYNQHRCFKQEFQDMCGRRGMQDRTPTKYEY